MKKSTRNLVLAALFVALSFVGANLKVMGSIAFDSLPAFLGTLLLGYGWGAAIGIVAHLLTAMTSGLPLTLPGHLITAVMMGGTMVLFLAVIRLCARMNLPVLVRDILGCVVAELVNGPLCLLVLTPLLQPVMGVEGILAMAPVLSLVAGINVVLAVVVYRLLPRSIREREGQTHGSR